MTNIESIFLKGKLLLYLSVSVTLTGGVPVAHFQTDGRFTTSTWMEARPAAGFSSYSVCLRMFIKMFRGTYNIVFSFGNAEIPDLIYICKSVHSKELRSNLIEAQNFSTYPMLLLLYFLKVNDFNDEDIETSGTTVKFCQRNRLLTKHCLDVPMEQALFESWTHVCMTVDFNSNNGTTASADETHINGYINGKLVATGEFYPQETRQIYCTV